MRKEDQINDLEYKIDLNKEDLINMICGTLPSYEIMNKPPVNAYGSYTGGFVDKWDWNERELSTLTEEQLYEIYTLCKRKK